jgi:NADPH-dependent glutamate synthase beta subunit-like oxidoreductase
MPPSGRRRARKESVQDPSDADTADMLNTPSRKRRRVNGIAGNSAPAKKAKVLQVNGGNTSSKVARVTRAESAGSEGTVAHDNSDDEETSFAKQMAYADKVIQRLRTASYQVNAALLYGNEHNKTMSAFARISGKDWADRSVLPRQSLLAVAQAQRHQMLLALERTFQSRLISGRISKSRAYTL